MAEPDYLAMANSVTNTRMWVLKWLHDLALAMGADVDGAGSGQIEIVALPPSTVAYGAITNAYVAVGLIGADEQVSSLFMKNTTDVDIAVSIDGTNQWEVI